MARVGKDKQPRKHSGKPRKEKIVEALTQKLEASTGVVFADYQGLTTKQVEDMKKHLKEAEASFSVTKNSLLKLSLAKSRYADQTKDFELEHPTATLFLGTDTIIPLKALAKAFKDYSLPKIKFGIIDGQALDEAGVLKLASLPPRAVLLAQLTGTINSPIQGLVLSLNGVLQKFVLVLDAVARLPRPEPSDGGQAKSKPAASDAAPAAEQSQPEAQPVQEQEKSEAPNPNIETSPNAQNTNG
jgi:large subunit ribosomal protein L10